VELSSGKGLYGQEEGLDEEKVNRTLLSLCVFSLFEVVEVHYYFSGFLGDAGTIIEYTVKPLSIIPR
jgi:hypothetical protein